MAIAGRETIGSVRLLAANDGNPPKVKRDVVAYDFNGGKGYTVVNAILIGYGAESGAVYKKQMRKKGRSIKPAVS